MIYHSKWKVFVKQNFKNAASFAALLGIHRNTANQYIKHPSKLSLEQIIVIAYHTKKDISHITKIITEHEYESSIFEKVASVG
jgi:DNA-binding transcriptional regulator YdaS (Cro superfamily)